MSLSRDHLTLAADTLGLDRCYLYCGRFHFMVDAQRSIALTIESRKRIRVDTYDGLHRDGTIGWAFSHDHSRLADLVNDAHRSLISEETRVG